MTSAAAPHARRAAEPARAQQDRRRHRRDSGIERELRVEALAAAGVGDLSRRASQTPTRPSSASRNEGGKARLRLRHLRPGGLRPPSLAGAHRARPRRRPDQQRRRSIRAARSVLVRPLSRLRERRCSLNYFRRAWRLVFGFTRQRCFGERHAIVVIAVSQRRQPHHASRPPRRLGGRAGRVRVVRRARDSPMPTWYANLRSTATAGAARR